MNQLESWGELCRGHLRRHVPAQPLSDNARRKAAHMSTLSHDEEWLLARISELGGKITVVIKGTGGAGEAAAAQNDLCFIYGSSPQMPVPFALMEVDATKEMAFCPSWLPPPETGTRGMCPLCTRTWPNLQAHLTDELRRTAVNCRRRDGGEWELCPSPGTWPNTLFQTSTDQVELRLLKTIVGTILTRGDCRLNQTARIIEDSARAVLDICAEEDEGGSD